MSFGSDSPGGAAEGIGGNEGGIGNDGGSDGMGGFGGLGIGNPGSYGGTSSVGAAGFGSGYGGTTAAGDLGAYGVGANAGFGDKTSTQHATDLAALETALGINADSFSTGYAISSSQSLMDALRQSTSPQNVAGAMTAGLVGALGGKFGSVIGGAIGGSVFGPMGTVVGGLIGSKYGKTTAQAFGEDVMAGIRDGTIGTADDIGSVAEAHGIDRGEAEQALQEGLVSGYSQLTGATGGTMSTPAGTQASYQQQALDYLKLREQVPWQVGDAALQRQAGAMGLPGFEEQGTDFYNSLTTNSMYTSMIEAGQAGKQSGEEAIMRNAGMTGGLRSGNVQEALYDYNTQFDTNLQNQALTSVYNNQISGLQGLAGTPSNANMVGQTMAGIGETEAAGQLAEQQADEANKAMWAGVALEGYKAVGGYEGIADIGKSIYEWF